jgi:SAM-dependent methyltransferase
VTELGRRLRRAIRRVLPRPSDPWLDAPAESAPLDVPYAAAHRAALHESETGDPFAAGRFDDAKRWRGILDRLVLDDGLVLDLGSGNGGVALALAAGGRRVVTTDRGWSETARLAHAAAGAPYRHVIADAAALPFRDAAFTAILCLDSFEHFAAPAQTATEASRTARAGAPIVVETPGRLTYLFRRDPHFNIRFILFLPSRLQMKVALRRGFTAPHHYVHRIYTSATSIARLFPHCRLERILGRSRFPKRWFFSAVIVRKDR